MAAARLSGKRLFLGAYPITPASDILHELARHKNFDVLTFQAEDEIAAMTATIGAAFAGAMAVTASSGPGIALKGEGMGLAVMTELPMIIINVQRGGPSTGLPTKTEQADLLQAMFGRNGECPMPVIAACSPADCFDVAQEAWRIAVRYMTPVMLLTDGYIANGSEPWRIPKYRRPAEDRDQASRPAVERRHVPAVQARRAAGPPVGLARHARPEAPHRRPGKAGHHRQRELRSGQSPAHGQHAGARKWPTSPTTSRRKSSTARRRGDLLVLSWGGTYGACATAVHNVQAKGKAVTHCHLRYLNPLPKDLGDILKRFKKVLIPELNLGQLRTIIRAKYLVDAIGLNKVQGKPFSVAEVVEKIEALLQRRHEGYASQAGTDRQRNHRESRAGKSRRTADNATTRNDKRRLIDRNLLRSATACDNRIHNRSLIHQIGIHQP